jgi:hypothetical protein
VLNVEVLAGSELNASMKDMSALSKRVCITVSARFNGGMIVAHPDQEAFFVDAPVHEPVTAPTTTGVWSVCREQPLVFVLDGAEERARDAYNFMILGPYLGPVRLLCDGVVKDSYSF